MRVAGYVDRLYNIMNYYYEEKKRVRVNEIYERECEAYDIMNHFNSEFCFLFFFVNFLVSYTDKLIVLYNFGV